MGADAPRHVYVHVPFCRARCDYCDFYSVPVGGLGGGGADSDPAKTAGASEPAWEGGRGAGPTRLLDRFVDAVLAEWESEGATPALDLAAKLVRAGTGRGGAATRRDGAAKRWDGTVTVGHGVARRLHSVYVGGGTPSLLGVARLERLLRVFDAELTPRAEVTVETNPEDVTAGYARWAAGRMLRVSLGVQSFKPRLRNALGRRAQADPAAAFRRLRRAGCANVGIDLIFGIPGQTAADLDADLATVARLRPEHVSWYELDVVAGTALAARLEAPAGAGLRASGAAARATCTQASAGPDPGGSARPDADARAGMYRTVVRGLERLGYTWYEVSNFALPGRRCRHNAAIWRGEDYLGLGPGAVGTLGDERCRNVPDVEAYVAALAPGHHCGSAPAPPPRESERSSAAERARERLYLAARTGAAAPLRDLQEVLDMDALGILEAARFVRRAGGTLRVTRKGRYVADEVCVRLFRTVRPADT